MEIGMAFIAQLLEAYTVIILIRVILSWVMPGTNNQFTHIIYQATEPVLGPIRRAIPPIGGNLDLSPVIAIVLIQVIIRAIL
jgi:YggT family protein